MKIKYFVSIALSALVLAFASCGKPEGGKPEEPEDLGIAPEFMTVTGPMGATSPVKLAVGGTLQLEVKIIPSNANPAMEWSSSNPAAAGVDETTGLVSGLGDGMAIIEAKAVSGGKTATFTVEVKTFSDVNVLDEIADPIFKAYCVAQLPQWDRDEDGRLSADEADAVTEIWVNNAASDDKIASMEGVEYFTGLSELTCGGNELTEIDLSALAELTYLAVNNNKLEELDLSANTKLQTVYCFANLLEEIDLSMLPDLVALDANTNRLTAIDVESNPELDRLELFNNRLDGIDVIRNPKLTRLCVNNCGLTEIDLSGNPKLNTLWVHENDLDELDLSACTVLEYLFCADNNLTQLDVSQMTSLQRLHMANNRIATVDVSRSPKLSEFHCTGNLLATVDISKNPALIRFDCTGNPGDGVSAFPVRAWFDNNTMPDTTTDPNMRYTGDGNPTNPYGAKTWVYEGKNITVDYAKAN
ncbi:MAG: Ig-like domain-containing protein [Alistipes sp.]|nr:Ig-like domain-containing protein [Alistipes sp.]